LSVREGTFKSEDYSWQCGSTGRIIIINFNNIIILVIVKSLFIIVISL
jgi:hypothetical protein